MGLITNIELAHEAAFLMDKAVTTGHCPGCNFKVTATEISYMRGILPYPECPICDWIREGMRWRAMTQPENEL